MASHQGVAFESYSRAGILSVQRSSSVLAGKPWRANFNAKAPIPRSICMALGQIDPARLEGDALRNWYRRSPIELERDKATRTLKTYNQFKSNIKFGTPPQVAAQSPRPAPMKSAPAQSAPKRFWDYWGVPGCSNCHGYTPDTLPPIGGHLPSAPNYSPRTGSGSGSAPRRERRQCDQQYESDSEVCRDAKSRICWENAANRLGHCSQTGEVGFPPLRFGKPRR